ncbi:MAG: YqgE/AlgH family protein [Akkermansiaceae bacterium]|nr:YqgE/AlgH family protein [Akkermansiaceae bacterium]
MATDSTPPDHSIQLQGQLLLADPSLRSSTFRRSVILLADHHAERGAFGLILNHPSGKMVGDLLPGDQFAPLRKLPVHLGGPVQSDQLTFSSFWWSKKLGLRWSLRVSAEEACAHAKKPGHIVRAFIGYSGWTAGQLESELRHQSWILAQPQNHLLEFTHDLNLWAEILRGISPLHRILAEAPDDPSLN